MASAAEREADRVLAAVRALRADHRGDTRDVGAARAYAASLVHAAALAGPRTAVAPPAIAVGSAPPLRSLSLSSATPFRAATPSGAAPPPVAAHPPEDVLAAAKAALFTTASPDADVVCAVRAASGAMYRAAQVRLPAHGSGSFGGVGAAVVPPEQTAVLEALAAGEKRLDAIAVVSTRPPLPTVTPRSATVLLALLPASSDGVPVTLAEASGAVAAEVMTLGACARAEGTAAAPVAAAATATIAGAAAATSAAAAGAAATAVDAPAVAAGDGGSGRPPVGGAASRPSHGDPAAMWPDVPVARWRSVPHVFEWLDIGRLWSVCCKRLAWPRGVSQRADWAHTLYASHPHSRHPQDLITARKHKRLAKFRPHHIPSCSATIARHEVPAANAAATSDKTNRPSTRPGVCPPTGQASAPAATDTSAASAPGPRMDVSPRSPLFSIGRSHPSWVLAPIS